MLQLLSPYACNDTVNWDRHVLPLENVDDLDTVSHADIIYDNTYIPSYLCFHLEWTISGKWQNV